MTQTAVSGLIRSLRSQPSVPGRVVRGSRAGLAQMFAERERHRLARELHDGAVQEILAAGLAIDLCLADTPAGSPAYVRLEHARQLTTTAVRRLRSTLQGLRDGTTAPDQDLPDLLRGLAARHLAPELDVSLEVTGPRVPLPATVRQSLSQMAGECVFNAAIHGRARRAVIRLNYGSEAITLSVADDGHGNPKTVRKIIRGSVPGTGGYHLGLADIAARADEMGWTLRADRSDLGGIAIQVSLPGPADDYRQGGRDG